MISDYSEILSVQYHGGDGYTYRAVISDYSQIISVQYHGGDDYTYRTVQTIVRFSLYSIMAVMATPIEL